MASFLNKGMKQSEAQPYFTQLGRISLSNPVFHAQIPFFTLKFRF